MNYEESGHHRLSCNMERLENRFESITIKKNNLGNYVLYGLMWWEFVQDGKPIKSLVSIKSNNLRWNINIEASQDYERIYIGSTPKSFLLNATRKILYNFSFTNMMSNDVLLTLTILNDGRDGFMKYNIYENLDSYIVKINVSGVKKDEIKIILEDGIIKVKTNPKPENLEDIETKLIMFEPVKSETEIYLPNIESVEAKLEDGILTLVAPKKSKGIKIDII